MPDNPNQAGTYVTLRLRAIARVNLLFWMAAGRGFNPTDTKQSSDGLASLCLGSALERRLES
jgi:hypothetical protein